MGPRAGHRPASDPLAKTLHHCMSLQYPGIVGVVVNLGTVEDAVVARAASASTEFLRALVVDNSEVRKRVSKSIVQAKLKPCDMLVMSYGTKYEGPTGGFSC